MDNAEVLTLLQIVDFTRDYPQFKNIHTKVMAQLAAIDAKLVAPAPEPKPVKPDHEPNFRRP